MRGGLVPAALRPLLGLLRDLAGPSLGLGLHRVLLRLDEVPQVHSPRHHPTARLGLGGRGSCFGSAAVTEELLDQPLDSRDSRLCAAWKWAACMSVVGVMCPKAAPGETCLPEYFFLFRSHFSC